MVVKPKRILIICVPENRSYWEDLQPEIEQSIGKVYFQQESEALQGENQLKYDLAVIDLMQIEDTHRLVARLRARNPKGRILIASGLPTWREARSAFFSGATDYIRKEASPQDMIAHLQAGLVKPNSSQSWSRN